MSWGDHIRECGDLGRQATCVDVIFGKPLHRALWTIRECDQAGSGENAHLSHAAAK